VAQSVRSPAIALTSKAGLPYKPPDFGRGRPDQIGIVGPRERPGCRRAAVSGDDRWSGPINQVGRCASAVTVFALAWPARAAARWWRRGVRAAASVWVP